MAIKANRLASVIFGLGSCSLAINQTVKKYEPVINLPAFLFRDVKEYHKQGLRGKCLWDDARYDG